MKSCTDIRPLLLEAEPEELTGAGDSDVARHVRDCAACAAAARAILEDTAALDRYLAEVTTTPDVEAILAAAGVGADTVPAAESPVVETKVLRFPAWRRWSALAAAAAVAGLLFFRPDSPLPGAPLVLPEAPPLVEVASDQNVAVMATADPDITVLWFF